ncbi:putative glucosamine-phosphate N-acetyltransferase transcription regulator GNAT family [Helianthus annuus]|uniref:Glucosamine-phosphate N-acetyltransferase transcription regulator GNAT family n=2 Tax=Helianthus annuus TaxID=4232 RepID=A0A9K3I7D2_HELAN|nr:serotonin N-acetyltransferase 2, chloroplastic [Helianthus annuus]KAF5791606.1 putative glucosamine-phosphate N-acetyltransferase transcription regulator GNAT family [Helianthus annuus]KAJ0526645.1 putative glucosamine-phosphate N-acetyltransferase transcription regulator GNAT family [Helianthus annuus]KAJ0535156.1 putative glucosamine-phosphate N-acetyltransferase transcription regulator GNAT family [Helianthus annuus]KAJ0543040.1 putative glucosamine-phosphate N-acetyltransferase transcrip
MVTDITHLSIHQNLYTHIRNMLLHGTLPLPLRSPLLRFQSLTTTTHHPLRKFSVSASQPSYAISDEELQSRGFILRRTIEQLNLDHLNSVFVAVGFPKRDTDKIRIALEHTDSLLWVEYETTKRPVAFARATGDGVFNAIIWDVVVDPNFQGIGLGKAVIERVVEELLSKGITNIALYSEPRVLGFYRPLGFVSDPDGIRGMVYSRKNKKN